MSKKIVTSSFWRSLPKPFFVLAPMANVTDFAFRSMIAKYGKPDVMWNEFVSADGLNSSGKTKLIHDLKFSKKEKPIVAQLFTGHPEAMKKAAKLCAELGFDGLDINMGCPVGPVVKQGGGAASIKDPKNAIKVLNAARGGFGRADAVSIKTRIGYNTIDMDWLKLLLEQKLPALTVHLRTRKEMSDVPAHWELMPDIVKLRDEVQKDIPENERTLIIGNGDVESIEDAFQKTKKYGCDGIMIGRGIFGKPWLFKEVHAIRKTMAGNLLDSKKRGGGRRCVYVKKNDEKFVTFSRKTTTTSHTDAPIFPSKTPEERLKIMVEHAKLFEKTFCSKNGTKGLKNFAVMKKHFKAYVSGWDGAKELRVQLMETENAKQVDKIVKEYIKK